MLTFTKAAPPTVASYARESDIESVRVGDDWHDCGGRHFEGKQLRFGKITGGAMSKTVLLVAPEVEGFGLVFGTNEAGADGQELVGRGARRRRPPRRRRSATRGSLDVTFRSVPVLGVSNETIEVVATPATRTRAQLEKAVAAKGHLLSTEETTVSGHAAFSSEVEAVPGASGLARAVRSLVIAVPLENTSILVACSCDAESFDERRPAFAACLLSLTRR